jgi:hypothetical protein
MASNTHARLVKHGVGVFIYGVKNGVTLKYEVYNFFIIKGILVKG